MSDYHPSRSERRQHTQRIMAWANDTANYTNRYQPPVAPSSSAGGTHMMSGSSSRTRRARTHTPSPTRSYHSRRSRPARTRSPHAPDTDSRTRRRSNTVDVARTIYPEDSMSHVSPSPARRSRRSRGRSYSPPHSQRVEYPGVYDARRNDLRYVQLPPNPAGYIIYPRDRRVHIVYPSPPEREFEPDTDHGNSRRGSLLSRIFGRGKTERRSRSVG